MVSVKKLFAVEVQVLHKASDQIIATLSGETRAVSSKKAVWNILYRSGYNARDYQPILPKVEEKDGLILEKGVLRCQNCGCQIPPEAAGDLCSSCEQPIFRQQVLPV